GAGPRKGWTLAARLSRGREAQLAHPLLEVGSSGIEAWASDPAPSPRRIREPGHVGANAVWRKLLWRLRPIDPPGDEYIRLMSAGRESPVGREGEPLSVRRKTRKAVESRGKSYPFDASAVHVHRPQVELASLRIAIVGGEDHPVGIGEEEGRKRGGAQIGNLPRVRTVGIGDPDLEFARLHQAL